MKKGTKGRVVIGALKDQKRIVTEYLKKRQLEKKAKKESMEEMYLIRKIRKEERRLQRLKDIA